MIALLADSVLIPFPPGTHADTRLTAGEFAWVYGIGCCLLFLLLLPRFRVPATPVAGQFPVGSTDHSPQPIHHLRHIHGSHLTEIFPCLFSSFCRFRGSAVCPACPACGPKPDCGHIANSGLRRSSWFWSRSTMALCIWLTRLSERSSVAPISFIVSSS